MKICHQPFTVNACAGRIEVRKSPSVGISQSSPSRIRKMLTGAFIVKRMSFAGTVSRSESLGFGTTSSGMRAPAVGHGRPPVDVIARS